MDRALASVDLYWLPLGAGDGTGLVRRSGRLYEAAAARWQHRDRQPLFHSALKVHLDGDVHVIEMAPVWSSRDPDRGVVVVGPVGLWWLGRSSLFRYEVRRWRNGVLPDELEAVDSPHRLCEDPEAARRLLALVPELPALTWGRDEAGVGDMWNSNSLVSWLLARSNLGTTVQVPHGGRAPGWTAGVVVAGHGDAPVPAVRRRRYHPR